jgi:hypothetical protein
MSHFVGLCFGGYWDTDLEQYAEDLEVEAYVERTKEEAINDVQRNQRKRYLEAIKALQTPDLKSQSMDFYQKIVDQGPSISKEDAWKEVLSWGYELDEDDNLLSTYNPNAKWDWYCVGGRWNGFLVLKERKEDGSIIEVNEAYFNEIDWDYMKEWNRIPFCFVNEDGEWYEKGEMGWFAITTNEMEEDTWQATFEEYINTVEDDCLVTVVDFHI